MLHFLNSCLTVCNICLLGFLLCCIPTPWALESSWSSLAAMKSAGTEGNGVGYSGMAFYPGMTWIKGFNGAVWSDGVHQRKQKTWTPILVILDDTKLSSTDTLEGRDALQRYLDRLETWAYVNLMKFSKTKHKILHLGQGNSRHAGQVMSGCEQPCRGGLGGAGGWKTGHELAICASSQERQRHPGLH